MLAGIKQLIQQQLQQPATRVIVDRHNAVQGHSLLCLNGASSFFLAACRTTTTSDSL
jgi:hypothetical protein